MEFAPISINKKLVDISDFDVLMHISKLNLSFSIHCICIKSTGVPGGGGQTRSIFRYIEASIFRYIETSISRNIETSIFRYIKISMFRYIETFDTISITSSVDVTGSNLRLEYLFLKGHEP